MYNKLQCQWRTNYERIMNICYFKLILVNYHLKKKDDLKVFVSYLDYFMLL